ATNRLLATTYHLPARSQRQQALEERPVFPQRQTEILSVRLVALAPLILERAPCRGKDIRQSLDHHVDERVGLLHRFTRLVDEASLDGVPLRAVAIGLD